MTIQIKAGYMNIANNSKDSKLRNGWNIEKNGKHNISEAKATKILDSYQNQINKYWIEVHDVKRFHNINHT